MRTLKPVWVRDGKCPNEEWHFRGAAREVYSYLKVLAKNHGGFIFASVGDIVRHTKKWRSCKEPFTKRHCERILRTFRELGVLGEYETRKIHGRNCRGWQFGRHEFWAETHGGICDFKHWESYETKHSQWMGNTKCESHQQNDGENVGAYVGPNVGDSGGNVGAYVGAATDVIAAN